LDRELVERAQDGDESAFTAIAVTISDRLNATAQHILRDPPRADDAAQQALIEIWRRLPTLNEPGSFDAWAYRILVRTAYAEAKRRRRRSFLPSWGGERTSEPDHATFVADRDQLDRALSRLPIGHRAVVVLKHFVGLSNGEIADSLSIPEGTVRSRLHYSFGALRASLEADARPAAGFVES
jgi:RNA polymerase sigma-70 factor (ECF subfamily)